MPCILHHEEYSELKADFRPSWEWHTGLETNGLAHWVEEPDLGKLDGEVREEDQFCAHPLLPDGWDLRPLNLVLVEVWYAVDDDPRYAATEVDDLVHHEAHDSGCQDIVGHVSIPGLNGH